jgi:hypothetical protein
VGGKVRAIPGKRIVRSEILQAGAGVAAHFLLLGETAENGIIIGAFLDRSGDRAAPRFGVVLAQ